MAEKKTLKKPRTQKTTKSRKPTANKNTKKPSEELYIIGIGTSAGGLEALKVFFDNVPENCQHSFVIVQHLSPDYKSLMSELLAKNTQLPIHEVSSGMAIEPGCIYLIPPKKNMTLEKGKLILSDKPHGPDLNLPIDIFFRSLAKELGERAIGIILTGTGSDGTRGLRSIKEVGGMIMVQTPETAKFDGMPLNAVATGMVDYVLPVEQLPSELINYISNPKADEGTVDNEILKDEETLMRIFSHLRNFKNLDFSYYKRPTLVRRISRRMTINKCMTVSDYLQYLYENPQEVQIICREFLIGVTKFFRDEPAFALLEKRIIPDLLKNAQPGQPIKLWTPGCSTGEEAYSIAILFREALEKLDKKIEIKIFATDIEKNYIDFGSKGVYPQSVAADIKPNLLQKYFVSVEDQYQISNSVRKMIIFSRHNAISDPPFNKMDLIVCRNLLIYLQPLIQKRVLATLHYALKLEGYLVLGPSETLSGFESFFEDVDRKWRIFKNKKTTNRRSYEPLRYPDIMRPTIAEPVTNVNLTRNVSIESRLAEELNEALTQEVGAAAVYVDDHYNILYGVGDLTQYISLPEKGFSTNILKMMPDNVAMTLGTTIRKAISEGHKIICQNVHLKKDNQINNINILVKPFKFDKASERNYLLILFMMQGKIETSTQIIEPTDNANKPAQEIAVLQDELKHTRHNLQSTIEELETSNEELQATNEELLAANEELQSTNEELQSVNEELHTVNAEYQAKIQELAALNADINNLLISTEIGTIFLDKELRIRKFTPAIYQQFKLVNHDIGRPIEHFTSSFGNMDSVDFIYQIQRVLQTGERYEAEVGNTKEDQWFLLRIFPFMNENDKIEGVVITFIDITERKKAEDALQEQKLLLESIFSQASEGIVVLDNKHKTLLVNDKTQELLGIKTNPDFKNWIKKYGIYKTDKETLLNPEISPILNALKGKTVNNVDAFVKNESISDGRFINLNATPLRNDLGEIIGGIMIINDVTRSRTAQDQLKIRTEELERSNTELEYFAYAASHDLQEPLRKITNFAQLLEKNYKDNLDGKAQQYIDIMTDAGHRMSKLISDLLQYSRVKRSDIVYSMIDPKQICQKVMLDMEDTITQTKAEIRIGKMPKVHAHALQMSQLLENLLNNSLKFRNSSRVSISVNATTKDGMAKFCVKDNGIGIDKQYHQEIFIIFKRLFSREEYPGAGVGLALCQKIVETHGGNIWVESEPGKGSEFYFTLPLAKN